MIGQNPTLLSALRDSLLNCVSRNFSRNVRLQLLQICILAAAHISCKFSSDHHYCSAFTPRRLSQYASVEWGPAPPQSVQASVERGPAQARAARGHQINVQLIQFTQAKSLGRSFVYCSEDRPSAQFCDERRVTTPALFARLSRSHPPLEHSATPQCFFNSRA